MRSRCQGKFLSGDSARDVEPAFGATGSVGSLTELVATGRHEPAIRENRERLSHGNLAACLCPRSICRDGNFDRPGATGKQFARCRLNPPRLIRRQPTRQSCRDHSDKRETQ